MNSIVILDHHINTTNTYHTYSKTKDQYKGFTTLTPRIQNNLVAKGQRIQNNLHFHYMIYTIMTHTKFNSKHSQIPSIFTISNSYIRVTVKVNINHSRWVKHKSPWKYSNYHHTNYPKAPNLEL